MTCRAPNGQCVDTRDCYMSKGCQFVPDDSGDYMTYTNDGNYQFVSNGRVMFRGYSDDLRFEPVKVVNITMRLDQ